MPATNELRHLALACLVEPDPELKSAAVNQLFLRWQQGELTLAVAAKLQADLAIPGRPAKPVLVPPLHVKRRAMNTVAGRAALIHALCHIEFNAINLALDAIWRFDGMPTD